MDDSLPGFLARAIALEHEAAERYLELADMMEAHRNDAVAALFRDMVHYCRLHHDSIVERARGVQLPRLRSWEFRWTLPGEVGGEEAFDPTLDPWNALQYALENETRAMTYYSKVGIASTVPEIRRLAAEFAAEETEHMEALQDWLACTPRPSAPWSSDPDRSVRM